MAWSATQRSTFATWAERELHVATRDLQRSVDFYSRVFGLCAIGDHGGGARVILAGAPGADLVLHEVQGLVLVPGVFTRAWAFTVINLEHARQAIWDLSVRIARDSGAPDQIFRWPNARSLYIRSPEGNEIELVEVNDATQVSNVERQVEQAYRSVAEPNECRPVGFATQ
jgi:catechol 2,3-dioxygenase-like lactoylglutathione lyase family enzyme